MAWTWGTTKRGTVVLINLQKAEMLQSLDEDGTIVSLPTSEAAVIESVGELIKRQRNSVKLICEMLRLV